MTSTYTMWSAALGLTLASFASPGASGDADLDRAARVDGAREAGGRAFAINPQLRVIHAGVGCAAPTPAEAISAARLMDELSAKRKVVVSSEQPQGGGFDIQYLLDPDVAADAAFVAGLELAAEVWESIISDPVTVLFSVGFTSNQSFIAATSSTRVAYEYTQLRANLIADAALFETPIVTALPSGEVFIESTLGLLSTMDFTSGATTNVVVASNANGQAMGFASTLGPGEDDGSIVFNLDFTFDPDPSDGVNGVDLVFVMAHELGHALGFLSGVDVFQDPNSVWFMHALDLFRHGEGVAANNPATLSEFSSMPREFRPNVECQLDMVGSIMGVSDGDLRFSTGRNNGDGRQSSHWKDDSLLGLPLVIGVMDPTYNGAQNPPGFVTPADLLAFSVIGWDIQAVDTCAADVTGDGAVGPDDLALLLGGWGPNPGAPADLNGDGSITPDDLALMLGAWGPC